MRAEVGDQLVVESNSDSTHRRVCQVVEVRGADGLPPYVVRWEDGHEGLMVPGPDAHVVARG
jgi:hypothetical protein